MNLFSLHLPAKKREEEQDKHVLVSVYEPHNTVEGSEFLDDAIRMKEQPLAYTVKTAAAACSNELAKYINLFLIDKSQ